MVGILCDLSGGGYREGPLRTLTHPKPFDATQRTITETGLSYLGLQQIKVAHLQSTPFLEYSCLYSGARTKREPSDRANLPRLR